jgi:acetylglutamate kinase
MATRIVFLNDRETVVTKTESQVVEALRRDHPNAAKLEGVDGNVMFVNWADITSVGPRVSPVP